MSDNSEYVKTMRGRMYANEQDGVVPSDVACDLASEADKRIADLERELKQYRTQLMDLRHKLKMAENAKDRLAVSAPFWEPRQGSKQ